MKRTTKKPSQTKSPDQSGPTFKRTTKPNKEKHAGGRPPIYDEAYHTDLAYKFCLLGCTDKRMAELFEVSVECIDKWKQNHPKFLQAIRKGKEVADAEVVKSLFHRALGYTHKETKFASHMGEITDSIEVDKHYPPDTTAIQFWLTNRTKQKEVEEKWVTKQEHDLQSSDGSMTPQSSVVILPAKERVE